MQSIYSALHMLTGTGNSGGHMDSNSKRQTITKLKFMGTLSPHEKIDPFNLKVETSSLWTPLKRLMSGSSRDTTMYFFSSTLERTFEIIEASLHSSKTADQVFCSNTVADLINAVKGLRAAQITYGNDKIVMCELEVLIETVQAFLMDLQKRAPAIFTLKEACVLQLQGTGGKGIHEEEEDGDRLTLKVAPRGAIPSQIQRNTQTSEEKDSQSDDE